MRLAGSSTRRTAVAIGQGVTSQGVRGQQAEAQGPIGLRSAATQVRGDPTGGHRPGARGEGEICLAVHESAPGERRMLSHAAVEDKDAVVQSNEPSKLSTRGQVGIAIGGTQLRHPKVCARMSRCACARMRACVHTCRHVSQ